MPAAATLHGKTQGFVLRLPPQNKAHSTFMLSLQCVLQHHVANLHVSTHMATPDDNNHAAIPMRSATTDSKTPNNYARTSITQSSLKPTVRRKKGKPTAAATAAHRRYLSSPAAATLHGKTQGFVLRLPPQHKPRATFMQPSQCILQHSLHHHFPSSPLRFVTTSLRHHFPKSPLPFVTTSLPNHFPSSPLRFVTTSQKVTTLPSSPLPFVTTSLSHHFPKSPHSLRHHFPKSPHSLRHQFP